MRNFFTLLLLLAIAVPAGAQVTTKKVELTKLLPAGGMDSIKRVDLEDAFGFEKGSTKGMSLDDPSIKAKLFEELNRGIASSKFLSIDASGKATGLFGKVTSETKSVRVLIDFGRYTVSKVGDKTGNIGYLLRLDAEITNFSSDADLSSVFAVGFAAKAGKIQGSVKVTSIGLSGTNLDDYLSTSNSISEDALLNALDKFSVLRSKIKTKEITINPDWLPDEI